MSDTLSHSTKGKMTGLKFLAIMVGAFTVIIGVNLTLAWQAIGTFPGLEVANGYVASQSFNEDRAGQIRLGWQTRAWDGHDGNLHLLISDPSGKPADLGDLTVLVGRSTTAAQDLTPQLAFNGADWEAPMALGPGRWIISVHAKAADGTPYRVRMPLHVER